MASPIPPPTSPEARLWRVVVLAVLAAGIVFGATQLAFLCDDAFILFRYATNARDGHGLVWNPPPFQPVEGYTQFLWVLCLWAAWSWFGVEPPDAANPMSIAFGLCLFAVVAAAAFRIRDRRGLAVPDVVVFVTLAAIAGNRTFLQWLTSGLDASLFNLGFVTWVVLAFRAADSRTGKWLALWSAAAAATALTRPDGLLLVGATAAIGVVALVRRELRARTVLAGLSPLLAVAAHVLWRRAFYGEWLPNTYYAKVVDPWPEAGVRYLLCFAFENSVWLWVPIAVAWSIAELRRGAAALHGLRRNLPAVFAIAVTAGQVGYYVLRVGGDPFEYRVLSHLVPMGVLAGVAMAARLGRSRVLPFACALALGLGGGVGWLHLALTEQRLTLHYVPIADKLPAFVRPAWRWHDRNQAWLHAHVICGRCHQHALFLAASLAELPERARQAADPHDIPVAAFRGVGVAGWVLPDVAVIDLHGLNDWVVARVSVPDYSADWLPKEALAAALARSDADRDGMRTRAELEDAFAATFGGGPGPTKDLVAYLLVLFANEHRDSLTAQEVEQIVPFFAGLRFMGHQRVADAGYVAAFDPNVTIEGRQVVVRKRAVPLTADRVRAIEREWRDKAGRAAAVR